MQLLIQYQSNKKDKKTMEKKDFQVWKNTEIYSFIFKRMKKFWRLSDSVLFLNGEHVLTKKHSLKQKFLKS